MMLLLLGSFALEANGREVFVRKKSMPEFFIPQGAVAQPKTVFPTPQYYSGKADSIKNISNSEEEKPLNTVAAPVKKEVKPSPTAPQKKQESIKEKVYVQPSLPRKEVPKQENQVVYENDPSIPDYQKKYQEYLGALEYVAEGKKMPRDPLLESDLSAMSSNTRELIQKRIEDDKGFNQKR